MSEMRFNCIGLLNRNGKQTTLVYRIELVLPHFSQLDLQTQESRIENIGKSQWSWSKWIKMKEVKSNQVILCVCVCICFPLSIRSHKIATFSRKTKIATAKEIKSERSSEREQVRKSERARETNKKERVNEIHFRYAMLCYANFAISFNFPFYIDMLSCVKCSCTHT